MVSRSALRKQGEEQFSYRDLGLAGVEPAVEPKYAPCCGIADRDDLGGSPRSDERDDP